MNTEQRIVTRGDAWTAAVVDGLNKPDRTRQLKTLLGSDQAVERFKTVAIHAIVHDSKLRDADPMSVIEAVREAATLGLEPTGVLGEAWILPYKRLARLAVGYRGYLKLIRRSDAVAFVDAQVVYLRDEFHVQFGTDPRIEHTPLLFGERNQANELTEDRGSYRGAYAWAQLDGTEHPLIEWMPLVDIEQARKASPSVIAGRPSPWDEWYGEMARKTVIRRLAKRLPLDADAAAVVAYEEQSDAIEADTYTASAATSPARTAALAAIAERRPADQDRNAPVVEETVADTVDEAPRRAYEAADGGMTEEEIDAALADVPVPGQVPMFAEEDDDAPT
jgi:phage RecT family recombinase